MDWQVLPPLALLGYIVWQAHCQVRERACFAAEREAWVRERRDLNNRIQVPQAAPFLLEGEQGPSADDLPVLPDFVVDEVELQRARKELADVGYEDGPAA